MRNFKATIKHIFDILFVIEFFFFAIVNAEPQSGVLYKLLQTIKKYIPCANVDCIDTQSENSSSTTFGGDDVSQCDEQQSENCKPYFYMGNQYYYNTNKQHDKQISSIFKKQPITK